MNIQQSYSQVDYLRGKNIFTIESKDVAQRLQKNQKSLASIKIDINFPKSINIYLASYSPIFQTDTYLILTNGSILEKQGKEYSDIPTIQISQDLGEYINYNDTLSSQEIQKIQLLLEESKKNILGFFPSHILYFPQEKELIIQDMNGVFYIFDLGISLSGQVKKLAIYNKESNSSLDSFLYIDLRITDRIFTCTKEISTICANNLITIYGNFIKLHLQKEAS